VVNSLSGQPGNRNFTNKKGLIILPPDVPIAGPKRRRKSFPADLVFPSLAAVAASRIRCHFSPKAIRYCVGIATETTNRFKVLKA
jgi:hypothetical protein